MPLELIVRSPKVIDFVEYEDRDPLGDEILVQTLISGIKHGTELNMYRGTLPFANELWDPDLRLFRTPQANEQIAPFYPHTLGSWAAGVVLSVGPDARIYKPGDLVHGEWKHRQTFIKPEGAFYPIPAQVDGETMVFTDPARFALAAIHDAEIKLGDRVAIFGLGAIGMLAIQMARLDGATQIIAVDPIPERLDLANKLGVDLTINPQDGDAAIAIKGATGGRGVDVAVEISGAYASLQQAIRSAAQRRSGGDCQLLRRPHHSRGPLQRMAPQPPDSALQHAGMGLLTPQAADVGPRPPGADRGLVTGTAKTEN